jgi:hypothetical protein
MEGKGADTPLAEAAPRLDVITTTAMRRPTRIERTVVMRSEMVFT